MTNPPPELDGANLISVASFDGAMPSRTRHEVGGKEVKLFSRLAIARYDSNPGFYLFYCDSDWNVITDTYHDTLAGAIAQAEFEFGHVNFVETS